MSTSDRKVVILLATYNGEKFIDAQLRSIGAQEHSNWLLVVSDDNSSDRTVECVERFRVTFPDRVRIYLGPRQGFARNFMSLLHRQDAGDYYAFCDQDDIWLPTKLQRALVQLERGESSTPALFFSRTAIIDQHDRVIGHSIVHRRQPSFQNALVQNIGGGNTMVFNQAAHRLLASLPADADIVSHDWFAYQLVGAAGGRLFYDSEPTVQYRQHAQNLVGSNLGLSARWTRIKALLDGRLITWNRKNVAILERQFETMTEESRASFLSYRSAIDSSGFDRIRLLIKSKVYRQTVLETAGLYLAAIANKI